MNPQEPLSPFPSGVNPVGRGIWLGKTRNEKPQAPPLLRAIEMRWPQWVKDDTNILEISESVLEKYILVLSF